MRIVVRVYKDEVTKPHHDEYKTDCDDEVELVTVGEDIQTFLANALFEIYEEED